MASLAALNQRIAAADILDDGRVITGCPVSIAAAFAAEQPAIIALPAEMFDPARLLRAHVDNRARICVRQNYYSVPARYASRRLNVRLPAMKVEVLDGPQVVAVHERAAGKPAEVHPRPLSGRSAIQARRDRAGLGPGRGRVHAQPSAALTDVLLGHRTLSPPPCWQRWTRAVTSGALDPRPVLIDARRLAGGPVAPVIPIGALAHCDRPAPALNGYDALLSRINQ